VFAAKAIVSADHIGRGRFGLNVVSGWNLGEFKMFGVELRDHDERYTYSEEWLGIVKRIWSETEPFDFAGTYFNLQGVVAKPKPWNGGWPLLMSAGSSPAGRAFAARHADCLFMVIVDEATLASEVAATREITDRRSMGVFASGHLLCRRTPQETRDYYHYIVHEKGDWEAAEQAIRKRTAGGSLSLPPERMQLMKERFISGGGTFPVIGSYDEVAATFKRIADAGIGGMAIALVNYVQEMPVLRDEVLPRLERLGLRTAVR
jgi:alkanesulfonate monooxygenase SsuD/methylene tetrahydromethanopterin reductase-like flavin-dependent oxidoreductase (luciferase family)